jgi:hypothetical protein
MSYLSPVSVSRTSLTTMAALAMVAAYSGIAQAQMSPAMRSQATALMQSCRGDYLRLCGGVSPGGGRVLMCLKRQANAVSPACAQGLAQLQALKDQAASSGLLPK